MEANESRKGSMQLNWDTPAFQLANDLIPAIEH